MELTLNRILNDRFVVDERKPQHLRVANSFWDWVVRIISWVFSTSAYSDANRRAICCFKRYLVDTLGEQRLQRITSRYKIDLDAMEKMGSALVSRDIAKIVIGTKDVMMQDLGSQPIDRHALAASVKRLSSCFDHIWQVAPCATKITGQPSEWKARWIFDPFLADRERLQICKEHPKDAFDVFIHNMVARVIKREMEVGTLIAAPNMADGSAQFYYVSGKLVTGEGMVSYIFHPATQDTDLQPMRLFRGTAARNSEIDGLSTIITDLESDLGRSAYESGNLYDEHIRQTVGMPSVEGGHSLGSAIVQYRLANMDHIQKAYLFCGPGIPEDEVVRFNRKNPVVDLVIRHSEHDRVARVGGAHIGYRAPANVRVQFCLHYLRHTGNPHTIVHGKEQVKYYGIEGGIPEVQRDVTLHSASRYAEKVRSTIGPPIASLLKQVRSALRWLPLRRSQTERGLKIGRYQNGRWHVEHFPAVRYNGRV